MAKEAIAAMMAKKEHQVVEDVEDRLRSKKGIKEKPIIKTQGNKQQYKHQEKMMAVVEEVEKAINRKRIDKAQEVITRGKTISKRQMKLIILADREDWATVREHVSDELASDIAKAVRAVTAKRRKRIREHAYVTSTEGR